MVDEQGMGRFAREDVWQVLHGFGVTTASRATTTDATEEVILLPKDQLAAVDVRALTLALTRVLPHMKVWVVEEHPRWKSEPL